MKKIFSISAFLVSITCLYSCLQSDVVLDQCSENDQQIKLSSAYDNTFKEIKVGTYSVYYKILKTTNSGIKPTDGSQVSVRYVGKLLNGTIFDKTYKDSSYVFPLNPLSTTYIIPGFNEALKQLQKGDSATIIMPSCVAFVENGNAYGGRIPAYSSLVFENVVIKDVRTEEQLITDYIKTKKFKTDSLTTSATGLRIISKNPGTGEFPVDGKNITVAYKGYLIPSDGVFDPSPTQTNPNPTYGQISFNVGKSEVIKGWDEGIKNIRVGGSAVFIMPSSLGYGTTGISNSGKPAIPGYSPLAFEIILLSIN